MTTLSQNNSVAGSLVLNDYLNTSLQNTQVIGKETAVGRFEDPPAPDAGPLDHTLKPRSGNGGACSSLTQPRKVEEVVEVAPAGAFKTRCGRPLQVRGRCTAEGWTSAVALSNGRWAATARPHWRRVDHCWRLAAPVRVSAPSRAGLALRQLSHRLLQRSHLLLRLSHASFCRAPPSALRLQLL